jgi:hypothetical protein
MKSTVTKNLILLKDCSPNKALSNDVLSMVIKFRPFYGLGKKPVYIFANEVLRIMFVCSRVTEYYACLLPT